MQRRDILAFAAMATVGLTILPGTASAQQSGQPKTIKSQLPGTWTLLLADEVKADGTHVPLYGPNPEGLLIVTPDGRYSLQIMRVNRPRYAAMRAGGTADENKAALTGVVSHFGTYSVDEGAKALTMHMEGSLYPNWDGIKQTRVITAITDDVLTYNVEALNGAPAGEHGELAWKKVK